MAAAVIRDKTSFEVRGHRLHVNWSKSNKERNIHMPVFEEEMPFERKKKGVYFKHNTATVFMPMNYNPYAMNPYMNFMPNGLMMNPMAMNYNYLGMDGSMVPGMNPFVPIPPVAAPVNSTPLQNPSSPSTITPSTTTPSTIIPSTTSTSTSNATTSISITSIPTITTTPPTPTPTPTPPPPPPPPSIHTPSSSIPNIPTISFSPPPLPPPPSNSSITPNSSISTVHPNPSISPSPSSTSSADNTIHNNLFKGITHLAKDLLNSFDSNAFDPEILSNIINIANYDTSPPNQSPAILSSSSSISPQSISPNSISTHSISPLPHKLTPSPSPSLNPVMPPSFSNPNENSIVSSSTTPSSPSFASKNNYPRNPAPPIITNYNEDIEKGFGIDNNTYNPDAAFENDFYHYPPPNYHHRNSHSPSIPESSVPYMEGPHSSFGNQPNNNNYPEYNNNYDNFQPSESFYYTDPSMGEDNYYTEFYAKENNEENRVLFVERIDPSMGLEELLQVFNRYGKIEDSHLVYGKPGSCNFAFVKFENCEDAIKAKSELYYARPFVVYYARKSASESMTASEGSDSSEKRAPHPFAYMQTSEPLQTRDSLHLSQMLDSISLSLTKDAMKSIKDWILIRARSATAIAQIVANYAFSLSAFKSRLNMLYLIHDILCHCASKRSKKAMLDKITESFEPHLKTICPLFAGESPKRLAKVLDVIGIWESRKIFSADKLEYYRSLVFYIE